ncbi:hypothetical protein DID88_009410 [Monilinia fructigena]|uniref:Orn/DAP/Arg decarboxylase 2 N-terminal domain-containing protein n=1 Tax=Monilinia fructigena TaxID=38457 RepID=A0A395IMX0_9HELO|nr:hypothetical protein DID88_009410 [Monilinia fructigena]
MRWKKNLPRVKPFYAVKCNPDPQVIRLLAELGTALIPCKTNSYVRYAANQAIEQMTFDNGDELHKMKKLFPDAELFLRISTDDSSSLCRLSSKFGAAMNATNDLLALAKSLDLSVVGPFRMLTPFFEQAFTHGYHLHTLDVGGGFCTETFELMAGTLGKALDELMPSHINIIGEPGRYYVSKAFTLACNIIARRTVEDADPLKDPSLRLAAGRRQWRRKRPKDRRSRTRMRIRASDRLHPLPFQHIGTIPGTVPIPPVVIPAGTPAFQAVITKLEQMEREATLRCVALEGYAKAVEAFVRNSPDEQKKFAQEIQEGTLAYLNQHLFGPLLQSNRPKLPTRGPLKTPNTSNSGRTPSSKRVALQKRAAPPKQSREPGTIGTQTVRPPTAGNPTLKSPRERTDLRIYARPNQGRSSPRPALPHPGGHYEGRWAVKPNTKAVYDLILKGSNAALIAKPPVAPS